MCKRESAKLKKLLKQKNRDSWRKFCGEIDKNTSVQEVWGKIRLKNLHKKQNNSKATNSSWVQDFFTSLTPDYCQEKYEIPECNTNLPLSKSFSFQELPYVLKSSDNNAPGLDLCNTDLPNTKTMLLNIFNDAWI